MIKYSTWNSTSSSLSSAYSSSDSDNISSMKSSYFDDEERLKDSVKKVLKDELELDTVISLNYLRSRLEKIMDSPEKLLEIKNCEDRVVKLEEEISELRRGIIDLKDEVCYLRNLLNHIELVSHGNLDNAGTSINDISKIFGSGDGPSNITWRVVE